LALVDHYEPCFQSLGAVAIDAVLCGHSSGSLVQTCHSWLLPKLLNSTLAVSDKIVFVQLARVLHSVLTVNQQHSDVVHKHCHAFMTDVSHSLYVKSDVSHRHHTLIQAIQFISVCPVGTIVVHAYDLVTALLGMLNSWQALAQVLSVRMLIMATLRTPKSMQHYAIQILSELLRIHIFYTINPPKSGQSTGGDSKRVNKDVEFVRHLALLSRYLGRLLRCTNPQLWDQAMERLLSLHPSVAVFKEAVLSDAFDV